MKALTLVVLASILLACGSEKGACYTAELSVSSGNIVHYCSDNRSEDVCRNPSFGSAEFEHFDANRCCVATGGLTLLNPEDCAF